MQRVWYVFLFLMCGLSVQAQLRVGPVGGAEIAKFVYAPSDTQAYYTSHWQAGALAGMVINYEVNSRYSLHTELLVAYRRRSVEYNKELLEVKNTSGNVFLEVPALLRVSFPVELDKQDLEFYVNGGPSIAYWLNGTGRLKANREAVLPGGKDVQYSLSFKAPKSEELTSETYEKGYVSANDRFVWSFQAGGGVILDMGYGHGLMLDVRTAFGLGNSFLGEEVNFSNKAYKDNLAGNFRTVRFTVSYLKDIDVRALLKKGKSRR